MGGSAWRFPGEYGFELFVSVFQKAGLKTRLNCKLSTGGDYPGTQSEGQGASQTDGKRCQVGPGSGYL